MEIISQTIRYSRKELNKIIKKLKGNVDLVFDAKKLSKNEQRLVEYYHKKSKLNYLTFKGDFFKIIKKFELKMIYKDKFRYVLDSKDVFDLINELIDKLRLYDFWIINDKKIICLDHEQIICVINKEFL